MNSSAFRNNTSTTDIVSVKRVRKGDTDIDITPMIDVVFLLLIFFLVCSTIGQTTSVQVPKAKLGVAVNPIQSTLFTISGMEGEPSVYVGDVASGRLLPNDHELQAAEIVQSVEKGVREGKVRVMILADRRLFHGEVARISAVAASVPGVTLHFIIQKDE